MPNCQAYVNGRIANILKRFTLALAKKSNSDDNDKLKELFEKNYDLLNLTKILFNIWINLRMIILNFRISQVRIWISGIIHFYFVTYESL